MKADFLIPALPPASACGVDPRRGEGGGSPFPREQLAKFSSKLRGGKSPPFWEPPIAWGGVDSVLNGLTFLVRGEGAQGLRRGRVPGFARPGPASHPPSDLVPITSRIWASVFRKLV